MRVCLGGMGRGAIIDSEVTTGENLRTIDTVAWRVDLPLLNPVQPALMMGLDVTHS